jgi:RimJ/RimL family protein N-acetyltransferase
MVIETERLILRHAVAGDAEFIFELLNDPSFIENIGDRGIRTLEDARKYISDRLVASYNKHGYGLYVVQLKNTMEMAGICGLVNREVLDFPDIGFAFLPRHWRKGYALEASKGVLKFAKDDLHMKRILAITKLSNVASQGVLEKLGLRFEKVVKLAEHPDESKLFSKNL